MRIATPHPFRRPRAPHGRRPRLAVLASLALVGAACGSSSSPTDPLPDAGRFTATVTGAVSAQFTGTAASFGTASSPAAWAVQMTADDRSGGVSFSEEGAPRPTPGTYSLASALEHGGNAPDAAFTGVVGVASAAAGFGSISGTLTITSSSPTSVSGEFTFVAVDPEDESRQVTVTGSFTSENRDF